MIKRMDRHILQSVLALTGVVGLALTAIYTVVTFVLELGDSSGGGLGLVQTVKAAVYLMPGSLNVLMPLIALIGALMGLGTLARHGELTAMRAAGQSVMRMARPVMWAGMLLGLASFIFGDWLGPAGEQRARALHGGNGGAAHSVWLRDAGNVIQIGRLLDENHIGAVDILRLSATDGRLQEEMTAVDGTYEDGHWLLHQVRRTRYGDDAVKVINSAQETWSGNVTPSVLQLFILQENSLTVSGLWRLISYMKHNNLDPTKYTTLLWRKLIEPLSVIAMALFALPFVSGRPREISAGQRLLTGILVGVVYYVVNKVSVSIGDLYGWPSMLSAAAPTLLLSGVTLVGLLRAR